MSSTLRNPVLDHAPNSDTFQRHYLNRNVYVDLWAIHHDLNPQSSLIRQATSHGGSRDSRRIFKLSDQDIKIVKQDPRYISLSQQLKDSNLRLRSPQRKSLTRERKKLYKQLKAKKLKEVIRNWNAKKDHQDIERQARGEEFEEELDDSPPPPNERDPKEDV